MARECRTNAGGPRRLGSGATPMSESRPVPDRLTGRDGSDGSELFTVRVAERAPSADGLNLTVTSRWLPAPILVGRDGAPTREKSEAFGPVMGREVTVRSQN